MKIDLATAGVSIIAYPDGRVRPELLFWLLDRGAKREQITVTSGVHGDIAGAWNQAIIHALTKNKPFTLVAESDMTPSTQAEPLLSLPFNLTCVRKNGRGGADEWSKPTSFHFGMVLVRSDDLRRIGSPWVTSDVTLKECVCSSLAKKARALGLTAGSAGFSLRGRDLTPR